MKALDLGIAVCVLVTASFAVSLSVVLAPGAGADWRQWGQNPQHTGMVGVAGQEIRRQVVDLPFDTLVAAEVAGEGGDLLVHYQVPLVDGSDVFTEFKTGRFQGLRQWETQIWNEKRFHWENGQLLEKWSFQSDWKPVPHASSGSGNGPGWEPVFHAVLAGGFVYVPGFGGSVYKLNREDGSVVARINPFGSSIDGTIFVAGPLSADSADNLYYNALKLDSNQPWDKDVVASWLVKVRPDDTATTASFAALLASAAINGEAVPADGDLCNGAFSNSQLPWPPSPNAQPPTSPCGSQRPGINIAPAIAPDGTIYTVSRGHFTTRYGYLIAVNPDLSGKWAASLRGRLSDGCKLGDDPSALLPPNGSPGGCRAGARPGVDPATNEAPAGRILDDASSSPVVAPDGSILFGTYTRYNWAEGHLFKFRSDGAFQGAYPFGWDTTPAVYAHGSTYSIVMKDNHYSGVGSYCDDPRLCPQDRTTAYPGDPEAYFITQLDPSLGIEWQFRSTNTQSCYRKPDGTVICVSDHPNGFEWCINAPAVDANGVVYVESEDGNLYAIAQGGILKHNLLLESALGSAYTPLAIGSDGRVYAENAGHLVVAGE